jgi:multicomponent Na+:H+ antiporter subunit E
LLQLNFKIETIILGIIVSLVVTILSFEVLYNDKGYRYHGIKLMVVFRYVFRLIIEIYKAGFAFMKHLVFDHYEPVVFTVRLSVEDPVLLGIIANSITLTPGTITIKVDLEHHLITVMMMAKKDTPLKELEQPIHDKFEAYLKEKGDIKND